MFNGKAKPWHLRKALTYAVFARVLLLGTANIAEGLHVRPMQTQSVPL